MLRSQSRAQIKKVLAGMTAGAYVILALGAAALARACFTASRASSGDGEPHQAAAASVPRSWPGGRFVNPF